LIQVIKPQNAWGLIVGLTTFVLISIISNHAVAADVTLAWDPNSEPDLKGYGIYLSDGKVGPPYNLVGYIELSEFGDSESPAFTVTDLTDGDDYAIAVTAYNAAGVESGYSEPLCLEAGSGQIDCASLGSTSVNSGGGDSGGGGGGGCFISSLLK
jgi:hypothetical protein